MKELINQTQWSKKNYLYSIDSDDNNNNYKIEYIHSDYYKGTKNKINISTINAKLCNIIRERENINNYKHIYVIEFERILCDILTDLFNSDKTNFVKRHMTIRKLYEKHTNPSDKDRAIYEIYMDNTLLAFIKQTIKTEIGFIEMLEILLSETEENKRRCRMEVDDLYNNCMDFANKGGEL